MDFGTYADGSSVIYNGSVYIVESATINGWHKLQGLDKRIRTSELTLEGADGPQGARRAVGGRKAIKKILKQRYYESDVSEIVDHEIKKLGVHICKNLNIIDCTEIKELMCYSCKNIVIINAPKLLRMNYMYSSDFTYINAPKLKKLEIISSDIKKINFVSLTELFVSNCDKLKTINCQSLIQLDISFCNNIETINCQNLEKLYCGYCKNLVTIDCPSITKLDCVSLDKLKNINCYNLQSLYIYDCQLFDDNGIKDISDFRSYINKKMILNKYKNKIDKDVINKLNDFI
jgi:hypothetical protein